MCQQFVALCRDIRLLDGGVVAIDGSCLKAVNAKARNLNREKLRRKLGEIDAAVQRYLSELDRAAAVHGATGSGVPVARIERATRKLAHLRREADQLRAVERPMDATGESQVSSDPDARWMATAARMPRVVGCNVQSVVETEHHLIVAHEVTIHGYDRDALLYMMALTAREAMASDRTEAIADKGCGEALNQGPGAVLVQLIRLLAASSP